MNLENASVGCIRSSLWGDPDLTDIVEAFIDEMPSRMANVLDCMNKKDWEGLRRAVHQFKGAAGSYGFDPITPCAGRLEAAVRDGEPEEQIRQMVDELVDLCARVRCG